MEKTEGYDKYKCIICQEIVVGPHTLPCGHTYCQSCIVDYIAQRTAAKTPLKCPLCAAPFAKKDAKLNKSLEKSLKEIYISCECGKKMLLKDLPAHKTECAFYNKGVAEMAKKLVKEPPKGYVNRSTFGCPFCGVVNMLRKDIVEHVSTKHRSKPGVCPICKVQPYGDPNYVSPNLAQHMKMRHAYEIEEHADNDMDEEEAFQKVLEMSMKYK